MNIYQTSDDVFTFSIFNLLGTLDGHYEFSWNRKTDTFQVRQFGGYATLTSYEDVSEEFRDLTEAESDQVETRLRDELSCSEYHDGTPLIESSNAPICSNLVCAPI